MHLPAITDFDFAPAFFSVGFVIFLLIAIVGLIVIGISSIRYRHSQDGNWNIFAGVLALLVASACIAAVVPGAIHWPEVVSHTNLLVSKTQSEAERVYGVHLSRGQVQTLLSDQGAENGYTVINSQIIRYGGAEVESKGTSLGATLYKVGSEYLLVDESKISTSGIAASQLPHS